MKEDFIQKLREVSDRAAEALAELEAPETLEEAAQVLLDAEAPNPPPDDASGSEETATFDAESAAETETFSGDAESEISFENEITFDE